MGLTKEVLSPRRVPSPCDLASARQVSARVVLVAVLLAIIGVVDVLMRLLGELP